MSERKQIMARGFADFGRDSTGSATVEFAFAVIFVLATLAIILDLTQTIGRSRDASLAASRIALAIAQTCPDSTCVTQMGKAVRDRRSNIFLGLADADIEVLEVRKTDNIVEVTAGTGGMSGDVFDVAQAVTRNGETAVVIRVSLQTAPLLASFLPIDGPLRRSISRVAVAIRETSGS